MQACNAHGLYCVPLYDTLGMSPLHYHVSTPWWCLYSNAIKICFCNLLLYQELLLRNNNLKSFDVATLVATWHFFCNFYQQITNSLIYELLRNLCTVLHLEKLSSKFKHLSQPFVSIFAYFIVFFSQQISSLICNLLNFSPNSWTKSFWKMK